MGCMPGAGCRGAAGGSARGDDAEGAGVMGYIARGEAAGAPSPMEGGMPCWRQLSLCQGAIACCSAEANGAGAGGPTCNVLLKEMTGALTGLTEDWNATGVGAAAWKSGAAAESAEGGCARGAESGDSARGLSAGLGSALPYGHLCAPAGLGAGARAGSRLPGGGAATLAAGLAGDGAGDCNAATVLTGAGAGVVRGL